ncbi:MAG: Tad domain-containing protein [Paracoccaceae bacterium]
MTYFAFFILFMMLLVGGMGVDLMRNELERSKLQATLDRAILAAADLEQTLTPEGVVEDYFEKSGLSDRVPAITVSEDLTFRNVEADASAKSPTRWMKFLGVDELPMRAFGAAEERVNAVEISVVVDISGSMRNNNKMANLQDAAKTFVDTVIIPDNEDLISMSLVPYTAQTNVGEAIFDELNVNRLHGFSSCIDFDESDFNSSAISLSKNYEHMQHFETSTQFSRPINNPGCPRRSFEEIQAFSQDATALKNTIDQYAARANTAIHLGMKWGVAMLDPSFRPINAALSASGQSDPEFSNRPVSYNDPSTLKTVILMTDGQNVNTVRIRPQFYAQESHYVHWDRNPLYWYLDRFGINRGSWSFTRFTSGQADTMLSNICTAAKAEGILIWSIGFEVTDDSASLMRDCASSPSNFFRVEGVEISEAFEAIAKQINQLRLTQ